MQDPYMHGDLTNVVHVSIRDFILDKQRAQLFVQYSEWLSNPPSLSYNSNN